MRQPTTDEDLLNRIYPGYPDKSVERAVLVTDQNGRNIARPGAAVQLDAATPRPRGFGVGGQQRVGQDWVVGGANEARARAGFAAQLIQPSGETPQASILQTNTLMKRALDLVEQDNRRKRDAQVASQAQQATAGPVTQLPAGPGMAANPTAQQMKDAKLRAAGLSPKDIADMQAMREDARRVVMRIDSAIRQARMDGNESKARDLEFDLRAARKNFIDLNDVLTGRGRDLTPAQRDMRARDLQTQYASNRRIMLERLTDEYKQALDSGDKRRAAVIKDDIDRIGSSPNELNVPVDMSPADTFDEGTESGTKLRTMLEALRERNRLIDRDKQIAREGERFEDLNRQAMLGDAQSNLDRIALDQEMMRQQLEQVKSGSSVSAREQKIGNMEANIGLDQRELEVLKQQNPMFQASVSEVSAALKQAFELSQDGADFSTPAGRTIMRKMRQAYQKFSKLTDPRLRAAAAKEILDMLDGIGANQMQLYSDNALVDTIQKTGDVIGWSINPRRWFEGRGPIKSAGMNAEAESFFNNLIDELRKETERPRI